MENLSEQIEKIGIVPVVVLENADDAAPLASALCEGGLPCAEVTFRTAAAEESIKKIVAAQPKMLVGAGTVLTTEQVDRAVGAGAKFIVSPGFNPKTVEYCLGKNIPIFPGVSSAGDIEIALSYGLKVVKFFPAESIGGINAIKALSAPFSQIRFMPTGGINADNLNSYLSFNKVVACGGSWMVKGDLVKAKQFEKILELTKTAVVKMHGFELRHIGINCSNDNEAGAVADTFDKMFGFTRKDGNSSIFAGTAVEVMKSGGRGKNGHIAIATNSVLRAAYFLEQNGFKIDQSSVKYNGDVMTIAYLENEVGGFAVHLVKK